jgi:hypothetical protein
MKTYLTLVIILGLTLVGCTSCQQQAADRTARLRKMYPPGMSKEDVQAKWDQSKPDWSATRPSKGWESHQNAYLAKKLSGLEASSGKRIESVDRYWGPDGSMSLCFCWYFYDAGGKIMDVEWQYKSD